MYPLLHLEPSVVTFRTFVTLRICCYICAFNGITLHQRRNEEKSLFYRYLLQVLTVSFLAFRAKVSMSFETLQWLAQEHACNRAPLNQLPSEVQRYLVQALVCAGSATDDLSLRDQYWNQVSTMRIKSLGSSIANRSCSGSKIISNL